MSSAHCLEACTSYTSGTALHKAYWLPYYCPQMKFVKVMFLHLSVSHSVHRGGAWQGGAWQGGAWQGGAWQGGVHDGGACMAGGMWQWGMHGRGACVACTPPEQIL